MVPVDLFFIVICAPFLIRILPKSKKLAERANQRTFQRLAASVAVGSDATAAEQTPYAGQTMAAEDAISENGLAFVLGKSTKVSYLFVLSVL